MKTINLTLALLVSSIVLGQSPYQKAMKNALERWNQTESIEEFTNIAHQFERIAEKDSTQWEPVYYAILIKTLQGFAIPKEEALSAMDEVEEDYKKLLFLADNSEVKVLKGLYETVKIAKDPMKFGPMLSGLVIETYQESLAQNPTNPRALFNLAQFQMGAAKFWGKDEIDYCPQIQQSIVWFEQEAKKERIGFEPRWGREKAQEIWTKVCE